MEKRVCVIQTDFHQYRPTIALHSRPLAHVGSLSLPQHIHTQEAGMREREELRRAIEQSDRLLSRVQELEEQNSQLNKEKNEVSSRYRAEQESAQASEQRCVQLEKVQRELERQLSGLSDRLEEEEACSAQLVLHRDRLEAECSSLRRDLDELDGALTAAEQEKQSSDGEVRRLLEQLLQRDEEVQKLQKEKDHLVELSQRLSETLLDPFESKTPGCVVAWTDTNRDLWM